MAREIKTEIELAFIVQNSDFEGSRVYAVIFTSQLSKETEGYEEMAARMVELAAIQPYSQAS